MKISIEISYYPLKDEFIPPIMDFLERLRLHEEIVVQTNGMSTQIFGEYDRLMSIVTQEIKTSLGLPYQVFVLKIVNSDFQILPSIQE